MLVFLLVCLETRVAEEDSAPDDSFVCHFVSSLSISFVSFSPAGVYMRVISQIERTREDLSLVFLPCLANRWSSESHRPMDLAGPGEASGMAAQRHVPSPGGLPHLFYFRVY